MIVSGEREFSAPFVKIFFEGATLKKRFASALLIFATASCFFVVPAAGNKQGRLEQLVEANITAVHAYQILLARKQQNMDSACWPVNAPTDPELEALVAHQTSL